MTIQLPDTEGSRALTIAQAAAALGVHPQTIRRWVREGDLPAYRVGAKNIRVNADDLAAFARRIPSAGDR